MTILQSNKLNNCCAPDVKAGEVIQQPEYGNRQRYNISYRGTNYERTPESDSLESGNKNKTGKTVGIITAVLIALAGAGAIFVTHRGKNVLNKSDATLKEKFEAGWKDIFKKCEKKAETESKNIADEAKDNVKNETDRAAKEKAGEPAEPKAETSKTEPPTQPCPNPDPVQTQTLSVSQFIRDDIKWKIPEYDSKVACSNGYKYYKDGKLVMQDLIGQGNAILSVNTYTYDNLGKCIVQQQMHPDGYHRISYLSKTEDGIRTVRYSKLIYPKTKETRVEMRIEDYNKQGQQIRLYHGSPSRNNGNLHKVEIKYNPDDTVCGYVEYFSDGTIWEMTKVPNNEYAYDINVKNGNSVKKYINATIKDIPAPNGEESSVFIGLVRPVSHRLYKEGAGLWI